MGVVVMWYLNMIGKPPNPIGFYPINSSFWWRLSIFWHTQMAGKTQELSDAVKQRLGFQLPQEMRCARKASLHSSGKLVDLRVAGTLSINTEIRQVLLNTCRGSADRRASWEFQCSNVSRWGWRSWCCQKVKYVDQNSWPKQRCSI